MLTLSPKDYTDPKSIKSIERFYVELLNSMGIPVRAVNVTPANFNDVFTVVASDNTQPLVIRDMSFLRTSQVPYADPVVPTLKNLYHGNLQTTTWLEGATFDASYEASLIAGVNSVGVSIPFTFIRRRMTAPISDNNFNTSLVDNPNTPTSSVQFAGRNMFDGVAFKFLALKVGSSGGVGTAQVNMSYNFTGVKISY